MSAPVDPVADRLLIIDDDRMQRLLIGQVARRQGLAYDEAASIEEAVAHLSVTRYGHVVIDLSLGRRDGVEMMRHLAASGQRPAVIVISGFDARIRDAAMRFGQSLGLATVAELRKPLAIGELSRALAAMPLPASPAGFVRAGQDIGREDVCNALKAGEIVPHYQAKIDATTGAVIGAEALARWISPNRGLISPADFVPVAETGGLAPALSAHMLRRAVVDAAHWAGTHPDVGVAVNVSASTLADLGFPDMVQQALDAVALDPALLTLEVTESVALSDDVVIADVLTRLRIKGIQLSLDDFGTGYSSLSSLLRIPFGELKIDRSFIQSADSDSFAWKIARASLSLAREFGMRTVAEGIETRPVAEMLRDAGCDVCQGFLFAKPMAAPTFDDFMRKANARPSSVEGSDLFTLSTSSAA